MKFVGQFPANFVGRGEEGELLGHLAVENK
jgi:hypothetical protein